MSVRHPALRTGASLVASLLIAATLSGAVVAVTPPSARAGASPASAAAPAAAKKKLKFDPQLKYRAAERRVPVNVRSLARKEPKKRPTMTLPRLGRPTGVPGASGTKPSGTAPKVVVAAAPLPADATTNTDDPATQTGFAGLTESSGPDTSGEPPDPWVAVGPEHIVQAVNLTMKITDRQGGDATSVALADFFQLPTDPVTFNSDPHVIYDSLHGRWVATEVSWDCDNSFGNLYGTGYVDFAISRTSDPTGTWDRGFLFWADQLPDFPAPGTSTDKIGIANNLFDMTQTETAPGDGGCVSGLTLNGGDVVYMDWADLTNGGGFDAGELPLGTGTFTPRVAVQAPATTAAVQQVVGYDDGAGGLGVIYFTVTGSIVAGTGNIGVSYDLSFDDVMAPWLDPPQPQQAGPDTINSAVDGRPTDAIWQNNRFVTVSTYPCGTGPRDCVRVTELDTTNVATTEPTVVQDFLVHESGKDIFMGGVGLTGNGTLHVAWTRSSTSDAPSSYTAHHSVGATADSISAAALVQAGTGPYAGERWGDYVGVAQDPQVPNQAWDGNQYSGTTEWRTRITRLQTSGTTYNPIAAVRVLDTPGRDRSVGGVQREHRPQLAGHQRRRRSRPRRWRSPATSR